MTATSAPRSLSIGSDTVRQAASFGAIGLVSTVAYVALYAWLRQAMSALAANVVALAVTAVANTAANRRLTFEVRGGRGLARDHAAGLLALAVALAITTAAAAAMDIFAPHRSRLGEIAVLLVANAIATLCRFLLLRGVIDRRGGYPPASAVVATLSAPERIAS